MEKQRELSPQQARDAVEFTALLRRLKQRSGLTYRQLEGRAAERGEVLARSTLADVLEGKRLPRPELLAAFVRACGDDDVETWLRARERIAAAVEEPAPARKSRVLPVSVAAGAVVVAVTAAWLLVSAGGSGERPGAESPALPGGWVRLRPVSAPGLCLTDGQVRDRRYTALVAVQRPCDAVAPQTTLLEPVGGGLHRIQWHHPDHGKGCLKALADGPAAGLLEPWDACDQATSFRIEPRFGTYVLRVDGRGCVGIAGSDPGEGAEAVVEQCAGQDGQAFFIEPATPFVG
ncbi:helix-turn-helix transcriptional regulator [Saccharopolyspora taberi]|uniref:XRE family transcriptional regulator n=1 Tax=Saccharopolyspora taberi TaxID=60895 RepID=A0ABN3VE69_9PSEU